VRLRIRLRLRLKYRTGKRPSHSTLASASVYFWSGREDLNLRHPAPKAGALPGCATPRRGISAGCILPYCSRFFKSYSALLLLRMCRFRQSQICPSATPIAVYSFNKKALCPFITNWPGKSVRWKREGNYPCLNDVSNPLFCAPKHARDRTALRPDLD
jgi:hypothetical protein